MGVTRNAQRPGEPRAGRPHMPGYGILEADSGKGLLPWSWAAERLRGGHNYWVATTRPNGAPHVMPVWGVWMDEKFYFSTGQQSRKARNLAANPRCVICVENAGEAVIVEGVVEEISDAEVLRQFYSAYKLKYDWDLNQIPGLNFAVRPRVVFGFIEASDDFASTATRWEFPGK